MIKYDNNNIGKFNEGAVHILKAYKDGVMCFNNGLEGGTYHSSQQPCFWVTSDISHYEGNFDDVYDQTTDKWYKHNNIGEYEEYGVYGNTTGGTYYVGKLVVENGYEYEWDGTQWNNLGEVSGTTFIKSPEYLERSANANGYIGLGEYFQENTTIEMDFQMTQAKGYAVIGDDMISDNNDWRVFINYDTTVNNLVNYDFINTRLQWPSGDWSQRFNFEIGNYYIKNLNTGTNIITGAAKSRFTRPCQMYLFHLERATQTNADYGHIYSVKIKQNGTIVKDYIPWTDMEGNYGLYDKVANEIHYSTGQMTGSTNVIDVPITGQTVYPKYYMEKSDPADNVSFSSFTEARSYQCPWVLQKATIKRPSNHYYFDYNYEWVKGTQPTTALTKWVSDEETICYENYRYHTEREYYSYDNATWRPTSNLRPVGEPIDSCAITDNCIIRFEDSNVKALCVSNWGGNVVAGEITYGEIKAITSLGDVFKNNTAITSFNEFAYFKGITGLTNGEFVGCTNLRDIVIPSNVVELGKCVASGNTFSGCSNLSGLTILSEGQNLLYSGIFNNGSYWMSNTHTSTPIVFPDCSLTFTGCTMGYGDFCYIGYFQSSTPPVGLSSADLGGQRLSTLYCPIGARNAYITALNGISKDVVEYDFHTDPNGVLAKERLWLAKQYECPQNN